MEVQHERCAGLDIARDSVVVCVRIQRGRKVTRFIETFGTTTRELLRLSEWLQQHRCTHLLMEATGVYWAPIWNVLEGTCELVLANAAHVKAVPGRKTDVSDAQWLADLLAHGLVRASFVPPTPIQQLRDLTRTRKQLVREKTRHVQRIQKILERANIKLRSVLSDVVGVSGRAILQAIIDGDTDPERLVRLVDYRAHTDRQKIRDALEGRVTEQLRFLLRLHLQLVTQVDHHLAEIDAELERLLEPFRPQVAILDSIPGVDFIGAAVLLAEIGPDMSRFPTPGHLVSWGGLCPGNDKSAGKTRSRRIRKGNPWLKAVLIQGARSVSRARPSYLRAQFHRLAGRRGSNKAIVAVASSMLAAAHVMLRDGTLWNDLGADFFDRRDPTKTARRLVRRLEALGFAVDIKAA
jgi:transposase